MSAPDASTNAMMLENDRGLWVRFAPDGRLLEVGDGSAAWSFVQPCHGWSLRLATDGGASTDIRPSSLASLRRPDDRSLILAFDGLKAPDGEWTDGRVEVQWQLREGMLQGRILRAELPPGLRPTGLAMPDVTVPYGDSVEWVVPADIGHILENPCIEHRDAEGMSGSISSRMHMQFTAWLEDSRSLYLDARDDEGWIKTLHLHVGEGTARLFMEHLLPQPDDGQGQWPAYCLSIAPFVGGWYDAAQLYRRWALAQPWAARGPEDRRGTYVADLACWLWNRGRIADVTPAAKEVRRRLGAPVALDWYWWHKNPYDAGYPDYFPPREGHDAFCAAVKDLQEHGVAVQVYTNGMSWDQEEPDWPTEGKEYTIVQKNGEYFGIVFNTWMNRRLMQMCGATDGWRRRARANAERAAGLGLDGVYIDMIGVAGGHRPCYSSEHGHPPGGGNYAMQGFRRLFRDIRKHNPGLILSSEGVQENFLDLLEAGITLYTSWERLRGPTSGSSGPARPIPLFPAVYHGRFVVFGNYAHIDGITPYDELWPDEGRTDPADEKDWHALCPDHFALEIARTVVFGCQPLATNLTMEHLTSPEFQADVSFFLDLSRFYYEHREWLLWGDMLSPEGVHCDMIEVQCIKRMIFTRPDSIEPFVVTRPAVLHSAWKAPSGDMGLILINYTRTEQAVTIERSDGLVPADRQADLTLPPRSMCFPRLHG